MASKTINAILNLKDNMSGGLVRVSKNVNSMTKDMQKASKQAVNFANTAKKNFEKMGDKAIKLSAAFAGLTGGIIVKVGFEGMKELDDAAAKVKSIAGASLDKAQISKGLLKTSNATGINTTELGDTQYNAISSGISAGDSLNAAVTSAKLAKAGFTDANSALKILSSTMNVYGLKGQEAMQSISDKLLITQNLGVTTVAELADSMGSLTPIANSAGVGIDELMASMVGLTKNGIKTDEATTSLKGMLTSIISPTKESADMAKQLGIDFSVGALKSKGFVKFMEEIKQKTGGSTEKMAGLFGNVRALSGALVIGGNGFKDMSGAMDAMQNSTGATDEAFAVMNNTLGSKLNKLKNRLKNIATQIMEGSGGKIGEVITKLITKFDEMENSGSLQAFADKVSDIFTKLYDGAKKVFGFLNKNKDTIANIVIVFASFYTAIKIMGILKTVIFGVQIAMAILNGTMALNPIGIITIAIGALIAIGVLLWKNWDTIKAKALLLWEGIKTAFAPVVEFFAGLWDGVKSGFRDLVNFIIDGVNLWLSILLTPINTLIKAVNLLPDVEVPEISLKLPKIPKFATGTQYFKGGFANINEHGGEIVDLPNGSKVIPADKSKGILNGKNAPIIQVIIQGNVIGNERYADYVATVIANKLKQTSPNLA